MISTLYIKCNAANPQMVLKPFTSMIGSPSTVRIVDVPTKVGKWKITDVFVTVTYPENIEYTTKCVLHSGVWQGTINAPTKAGKITDGYKIIADGIDENGDIVKNYVLGKGDVNILGDTLTTEDGISYVVHLRDEEPESPNKGDIVYDENGNGSGYKIWNGEEWVMFGTDYSSAISSKADISTVTELSNSLSVYAKTENIPTKTSELTNDSGYLTEIPRLSDYALVTDVEANFQRKGNYLTEHQSLSGYAKTADIPTKTSALTNDSGYLTAHQSLDNYYTKSDVDNAISSKAAASALTSHTSDKNNPHEVTCEQIGAASVEDLNEVANEVANEADKKADGYCVTVYGTEYKSNGEENAFECEYYGYKQYMFELGNDTYTVDFAGKKVYNVEDGNVIAADVDEEITTENGKVIVNAYATFVLNGNSYEIYVNANPSLYANSLTKAAETNLIIRNDLAKKSDIPTIPTIDISGKVDKVSNYGLATIIEPNSYGAAKIEVQKEDGTKLSVGVYSKEKLDTVVSTINNSISSKAAASALTSHTSSTSNPHAVTAAQVGAYTTTQVDNAISSAISGLSTEINTTLGNINSILEALA